MAQNHPNSSGHNEGCHPPDKLQHVLQGWPPAGPNAFRWENQRLMFSIGASHLSLVPSPEDWAKFWKVCDEVDVWSWPLEIGDPDVIDGLLYDLEIIVGPRSVRSRGQVVGSPTGFEERLMKVHRGLQDLVGWLGSNIV